MAFGQMCGIRVGENNTYTVSPKVGGNITHAACEYNGIYGRIKSECSREHGKTTYTISVYSNTIARAILPYGEHILVHGTHEFTI